MSTEDFLGWVFEGGGLELYNELLQKELNSSLPCVSTPDPTICA